MYKVNALMIDNNGIQRYFNIEHFNEYKENDAIKNFNRQFKKIKMLAKNLFNLLDNNNIVFIVKIELYENDNLIKVFNGTFFKSLFDKSKKKKPNCNLYETNLGDLYFLEDGKWKNVTLEEFGNRPI